MPAKYTKVTEIKAKFFFRLFRVFRRQRKNFVTLCFFVAINLMKFRFVWIGKTKEKNWRTLQEEYLQRLSHFVRFETVELREGSVSDGKSGESKRILENVNQSSFVCLLDVQGKQIGSPQLAQIIEKWQNQGLKEIAFVIGGADGVTPEVVERADYSLSLSSFTLTHEMARVVLIEQLYRAYTIIKGFPYQK